MNHLDDDGDALRRLERHGDDLHCARDIDFAVVFPDRQKAEEFAEYFRCAGYKSTTDDVKAEEGGSCDVIVVKNMIPSRSGIADFEAELEEIAEPLGGYNDGWGCFAQTGSASH